MDRQTQQSLDRYLSQSDDEAHPEWANETLVVPGERAWSAPPDECCYEWTTAGGRSGIAIVEIDKGFVKELCRVLYERGIEVTLQTSRGAVTVKGKLRESVVEDWLIAYIRASREAILERMGCTSGG